MASVRLGQWAVAVSAATAGALLLVMAGCERPTPVAPLPGAQAQAQARRTAITPEQRLGAKLFFEPKLSADQTLSCGICHQPDKGYSDGKATAIGIKDQKGTRNTPSILDLASSPHLFWDGRAKTLEQQALMPITNPIEMGADLPTVVDRLQKDDTYRTAFQSVYQGPPSAERLGKALAAFERALVQAPAPWDRFMAGDMAAMTEAQQRGWGVFRQAGCAVCHTPPAFTDRQFHNVGQGTTLPHPDIGRMGVTKDQSDWASFKTPSLRNVARSAPYMHDGTLRTLRAVVAFYQQGGIANPNKDPMLFPFEFMPQQRDDLMAFLEALSSDDNLNELISPGAQGKR
jgi:cytochrome c peroxidase